MPRSNLVTGMLSTSNVSVATTAATEVYKMMKKTFHHILLNEIHLQHPYSTISYPLMYLFSWKFSTQIMRITGNFLLSSLPPLLGKYKHITYNTLAEN